MENTIFRFDDREAIEKWLRSKNVQIFRIRDDLTVDVHGDVLLAEECFEGFPVKFGTVTGVFSITDSALTSLTGAPTEVWGDFICRNCRVKSFAGTPERVGGDFDIANNQIATFAGVYDYLWVKGCVVVSGNAFESIGKIHEHFKFSRIGGLDFGVNKQITSGILCLAMLKELKVLSVAPTYVNDESRFANAMSVLTKNWNLHLLDIQSELMDRDLCSFAESLE